MLSRQRRKSGFIRNVFQPKIFIPKTLEIVEKSLSPSSSSTDFSPFEKSLSPQIKQVRQVFQKSLSKSSFKQRNANLHRQMIYTQQNTLSASPIDKKTNQIKKSKPLQNSQLQQDQYVCLTDQCEISNTQHKENSHNISLADAFSANCPRLKRKLDLSKQFRKKKTFQNSTSQFHRTSQTKRSSINKSKAKFRSTQANSIIENKENIQKNYHNVSCYKVSQMQSNDCTQEILGLNSFANKSINTFRRQNTRFTKQSSFFIQTNRNSKSPISHRQMYLKSLQKWKKLPQVVAKEKQEKKQRDLKMRIARAKQHNRQVRMRMNTNIRL